MKIEFRHLRFLLLSSERLAPLRKAVLRPKHHEQSRTLLAGALLGRHGSDSLCRDERENKMAATYNVLAFKR